MSMKSSIESMSASARAPRRLGPLIAFVIVAAMTGRAHADEQLPKPDAEAARAHFDAGNTAFRGAQARTDPTVQRTEYEEAIKDYLAGLAIETKFHYSFYWNLGHAYRQLGEYTRADHFYKKFLEFAPARFALHRTAAEDFRRMMRAELDKAASLAEPTAPAPAPMHDPTTRVTDKGSEPPPSRARPWYADRFGWVLIGGGALGILGGSGFVLSGASLHDQATEEDRQSVAEDLRDRGDQRVLIGEVTGSVGVALLAAGVIKLALTDSEATPSSIQASVGPSSFSIRGEF